MNDEQIREAQRNLEESLGRYTNHLIVPPGMSWATPKTIGSSGKRQQFYSAGIDYIDPPQAKAKYSDPWGVEDDFGFGIMSPPPASNSTIKAVVEEEIGWLDEYQQKIMSNNNSKKKRSKARLSKSNFRNSRFNIDMCLKTFDKMVEKEVGDIAITGSVALFLQGKITRDLFSDLDISVGSGEVQLDDEFEDVQMDMGYDPANSLVAAPKIYYYNECLLDIFPIEKQILETVVVERFGKSYLCVDYKHILDAKLKMLLPKMKDYNELYNNCFEMKFL